MERDVVIISALLLNARKFCQRNTLPVMLDDILASSLLPRGSTAEVAFFHIISSRMSYFENYEVLAPIVKLFLLERTQEEINQLIIGLLKCHSITVLDSAQRLQDFKLKDLKRADRCFADTLYRIVLATNDHSHDFEEIADTFSIEREIILTVFLLDLTKSYIIGGKHLVTLREPPISKLFESSVAMSCTGLFLNSLIDFLTKNAGDIINLIQDLLIDSRPQDVFDNRSLMIRLFSLQNSESLYPLCDPQLKANLDFNRAAVSKNPWIYFDLDVEQKRDRAILLALPKGTNLDRDAFYEGLPDYLKTDVTLMCRLTARVDIYRLLPNAMKQNVTFMHAAMMANASNIKILSPFLTQELIESALLSPTINGPGGWQFMRYLEESRVGQLLKDLNFATLLVEKVTNAYRYLPLEFRKNRQIMEKAFAFNGNMIHDATSENRDDERLALIAIKSTPPALDFISTRLKSNNEFLIKAMQQSDDPYYVYRQLPDRVANRTPILKSIYSLLPSCERTLFLESIHPTQRQKILE